MLDALHVDILEKSCALRDENCEWQTFLIRLVTALKAVYKISRLCTLVGLPRSTYYWGVANTGKSDPDLEVVKSAFAYAKGVYGYRRVTDLLRNGFDGNAPVRMNHKKVARLMKVAELKGATPKRKHYRSYAGSTAIIPNLLRRNFRVEKPCTVLVTDITQISWGTWR